MIVATAVRSRLRVRALSRGLVATLIAPSSHRDTRNGSSGTPIHPAAAVKADACLRIRIASSRSSTVNSAQRISGRERFAQAARCARSGPAPTISLTPSASSRSVCALRRGGSRRSTSRPCVARVASPASSTWPCAVQSPLVVRPGSAGRALHTIALSVTRIIRSPIRVRAEGSWRHCPPPHWSIHHRLSGGIGGCHRARTGCRDAPHGRPSTGSDRRRDRGLGSRIECTAVPSRDNATEPGFRPWRSAS